MKNMFNYGYINFVVVDAVVMENIINYDLFI